MIHFLMFLFGAIFGAIVMALMAAAGKDGK